MLQEIYGIAGSPREAEGSNRMADDGGEEGEAIEISSSDCVICLTNKRELTILPCRYRIAPEGGSVSVARWAKVCVGLAGVNHIVIMGFLRQASLHMSLLCLGVYSFPGE